MVSLRSAAGDVAYEEGRDFLVDADAGLVIRAKSVYDVTGNGINHPNDFGHRVYAGTSLARLIDR